MKIIKDKRRHDATQFSFLYALIRIWFSPWLYTWFLSQPTRFLTTVVKENYYCFMLSVSRTIFIDGSTIAATGLSLNPPPSSMMSLKPSIWSFPWCPLTTIIGFSDSSCKIQSTCLNFSKLLQCKDENHFNSTEWGIQFEFSFIKRTTQLICVRILSPHIWNIPDIFPPTKTLYLGYFAVFGFQRIQLLLNIFPSL